MARIVFCLGAGVLALAAHRCGTRAPLGRGPGALLVPRDAVVADRTADAVSNTPPAWRHLRSAYELAGDELLGVVGASALLVRNAATRTHVRTVDVRTGATLAVLDPQLAPPPGHGPPAVTHTDHGVFLLFQSTQGGTPDRIVALDPVDARVRWQREVPPIPGVRGVFAASLRGVDLLLEVPAISRPRPGGWGYDRVLRALDAATGGERWTLAVADDFDLRSISGRGRWLILSSGGREGALLVLDGMTGEVRWRAPALAAGRRWDASEDLLASVSDGVLELRELSDGATRLPRFVPPRDAATVALARDRVLLATGATLAVHALSDAVASWEARVRQPSFIAVAEGLVITGDLDGTTSRDLATGALLDSWSCPPARLASGLPGGSAVVLSCRSGLRVLLRAEQPEPPVHARLQIQARMDGRPLPRTRVLVRGEALTTDAQGRASIEVAARGDHVVAVDHESVRLPPRRPCLTVDELSATLTVDRSGDYPVDLDLRPTPLPRPDCSSCEPMIDCE